MRPSRLAAVVAASLLAACGSSKSSPTPPPPPVEAPLPVATPLRGVAMFPQARVSGVTTNDPAPGWANVWVLDHDLSPHDFQGAIAPAGQLWLGTPAAAPTVDSLLLDAGLDRSLQSLADQLTAADLTFTGPVTNYTTPPAVSLCSTASQGCGSGGTVGPWAVLAGTLAWSGGITAGTRLQQVVTLASAMGATTTVTVGWHQGGFLLGGNFLGEAGASWRVTLRHPVTDAELAVLDAEGPGSVSAGSPSVPVGMAPLVGLTSLKLVFELAAAPDASLVAVDDVHLTVDGVDVLANGDFGEVGGLASGWTTSTASAPSRVVGAARTVGAPHLSGNLSVSRSVYVAPDGGWVRITDLVTNPAASGTVTTDAVYLTALGAGTHAAISAVPGTGARAWSAWDADGLAPDLAVVHGSATPYYLGATSLAGADGNGYAFSLFPLTVPAGQSRAIVHFVVLGQSATNAGLGAAWTARPAAVEATAKAILDGFASTPTYRAYMSAAEQAAIANF